MTKEHPIYSSSFHFLFHYPYITPIYLQISKIYEQRTKCSGCSMPRSCRSSLTSQSSRWISFRVRTSSRTSLAELSYYDYYCYYLGLYWGYIGIMVKKMETTIVYWGYMSSSETKAERTSSRLIRLSSYFRLRGNEQHVSHSLHS